MIEPEAPTVVTQPELVEAIKELYYWQYANTGSFKNMLFTLFQKADAENTKRLQRAFPAEYKALDMWNKSEDPTILFKRHGLINDDSGAV